MLAVVLQPSYIPWRGFFDLIRRADVFVFYDDVQYDKHGWRNRNQIKTPNGAQWITIPVQHKGNVTDHVRIDQVRTVPGSGWARKHWSTISQNYARAPFFKAYAPEIEAIYRDPPELLAEFTIASTMALASLLGISHVTYRRSSQMSLEGTKSTRLVQLLQQLGATRYLSGPSAQEYIEEPLFAEAGIEVEYIAYDYPEYPQLHPPFNPHVSILDLLFMTGPEAMTYIAPSVATARSSKCP